MRTRFVSLLTLVATTILFAPGAFAIPTVITEFYNTNLKHYVLITSAAEVASIENGAAGPGWQKTGKNFNAYTEASDAPGLSPVCRFYGSITPGPNSHFFTADPDECSAVKNDPGWHFEEIAFHVALPVDGECAADQVPVWRAYNNGFKPQQALNDGNHRFSIDRAAIRKLADSGWNDEGLVFCAAANNPAVPINVSVTSASLLLLPGTSRDVFLSVEPRNGFTGAVNLAASGLPTGVSYQFLPAVATIASGPVDVTLRLSVDASAPATTNDSNVTISGTASGGGSALAGLTVGVAAPGDSVAAQAQAVAAVEARSRELRIQGLSGLPYIQAIAAFLASRPEYEAVGMDATMLSAWGRFKDDGTVHVISDNLDRTAVSASLARADVRLKAGAELPDGTKARLVQVFGAGFEGQVPVDSMRRYFRRKGWSVRSGADAEGYVGSLMGVNGDGFFYLNTHGAKFDTNDPTEPNGMHILWTSTLSDPFYDRFYAVDRLTLRLVKHTARNFREAEGATPQEDTRYAITWRFVDQYMKFTNESVLLMNSCWSGFSFPTVAKFIGTFHGKGAGVYLGWSDKLHFEAAFKSGPYLVDRMVGANLHPDRESPPQRAFPYDLVLADMARNHLDTDSVNGGKLLAFPKPGLKYPPIFAPSIRYVRVNEYDEKLVLTGEFGEAKPKVTVGGTELALDTWSASEIVALLPQAGPGSSGDVVVEVRNVKSNARQLTEWAIPLSYNWFSATDVPEWRLTGNTTIRYRADLAGYRLLPHETPRSTPLGGPPTKDSALTVTASGSHADPGCTATLSGTGSYLSPASQASGASPVLASFFKMDGKTKLGTLGMDFGALAPVHIVTFEGPDCPPVGSFPFAATIGLLEGPAEVLRDQRENPGTVTLPAAQFTLDANYGIPSKRIIDVGAGGEINVFWPAVPANTPPRDTDDAGK